MNFHVFRNVAMPVNSCRVERIAALLGQAKTAMPGIAVSGLPCTDLPCTDE
jgi:hypothetical protein